MKEEDKRSLALVVAGALFGFLPTILSYSLAFLIIGSVALALSIVVALLYGTGILQDYAHRIRLSYRWKAPLELGVLDDSGWNLVDKQTYAWTDVHPQDWKSQLQVNAQTKSLCLVSESIKVSPKLDSYAIILNPYGEVYPERDLATLTSLRDILNFVREGGLFVNVAGIPSYWAYNPDLRRRLDIAQAVYGTIETGANFRVFSTKLFELTPLAKELGLRMVATRSPVGVDLAEILGRAPKSCIVYSHRFVIVESNVEPCTATDSTTSLSDVKHHDTIAPIFFVKYGSGEFLFSLPWINDSMHDSSHKEWLRDTICALTIKKAVEMSKEKSFRA